MSLKLNLIVCFLILLKLKFSFCQNLPPIVCANSYDKHERKQEVVNCILPDKKLNLNFECRILENQKLLTKNTDNVVEAKLLLKDKSVEQNYSVFYWKGVKESEHYRSVQSEHEEETFKYNKSVVFSKDKNSTSARLVLYKINFEYTYKICVNVPDLIEEKVCCQVEYLEEEEESNIFMVLIVFAVVVVLYVIVLIVSWKCPSSSFKTIDDLLEKLPTGHVEKLKNLVLEREIEIDQDDVEDEKSTPNAETDSNNLKYARYRKQPRGKRQTRVKISENFVEIDNLAYDKDEDEEKNAENSRENEEEEDIEFKLYKEALKLRRMSRMSVSYPPKFDSNDFSKPTEKKRKQSVKFLDNDTLALTEMDQIKLKIFQESKRRASVAPFKKAYDLDVSDSD